MYEFRHCFLAGGFDVSIFPSVYTVTASVLQPVARPLALENLRPVEDDGMTARMHTRDDMGVIIVGIKRGGICFLSSRSCIVRRALSVRRQLRFLLFGFTSGLCQRVSGRKRWDGKGVSGKRSRGLSLLHALVFRVLIFGLFFTLGSVSFSDPDPVSSRKGGFSLGGRKGVLLAFSVMPNQVA